MASLSTLFPALPAASSPLYWHVPDKSHQREHRGYRADVVEELDESHSEGSPIRE